MSETWYVGHPKSSIEVAKLCTECQHVLVDSQRGCTLWVEKGDGRVSREKRDEQVETGQWT